MIIQFFLHLPLYDHNRQVNQSLPEAREHVRLGSLAWTIQHCRLDSMLVQQGPGLLRCVEREVQLSQFAYTIQERFLLLISIHADKDAFRGYVPASSKHCFE